MPRQAGSCLSCQTLGVTAPSAMNDKLNRDQLLALIEKLMNPKKSGLLSEESYNDALLTFCAGCPDPIMARWLVVECLDPMTDSQLVERALAVPIRLMSDVPYSQLPEKHPLRGKAA